MAFQAVPQGIEAVLRFTRSGVFWGTNTLNFHNLAGDATLTDLTVCYNMLEDWWDTECKTEVSSEVLLNSISLRALHDPTGATYAANPMIVGTVASPALPPNSTIAVSFRTALGGRSYRGRNYLCGIPEAGATGKVYGVAYEVAVHAAYIDLKARATAIDMIWCVLSRRHNGVVRATGVLTPVASTTFTDDRMDSMKTRLRG